MRRYQGFEVEDYVFILDALPLKPSFFCNTGVTSAEGGCRRRFLFILENAGNPDSSLSSMQGASAQGL
jgi:hypothetical protein